MPWVCLPIGRIRHLAPVAFAALVAAHPIPAGEACHCTGTRLAWVPDTHAPSGTQAAHAPKDPGVSDPGAQGPVAQDPGTADVPVAWVPGAWGYHGPDWTPPVTFQPGQGPGLNGGWPYGGWPYGGGVPKGGGPGADPGRAGPGQPPSGGPPAGKPPSAPRPVPEPASGAVLAFALAALAMLRVTHSLPGTRRGRHGKADRSPGCLPRDTTLD